MHVTDMFGRELHVGDYVVFTNNLYQVVSIPAKFRDEWDYLKIVLVNKSKTTRPVRKYSREMCFVPGEDLTAWKLKNGI